MDEISDMSVSWYVPWCAIIDQSPTTYKRRIEPSHLRLWRIPPPFRGVDQGIGKISGARGTVSIVTAGGDDSEFHANKQASQ